ncbi:MAG: MAPEG family protein [Glaciecola sp.]
MARNCYFYRTKYKVAAPAVSGHPIWERRYRVQQNTLEQLIIFIPALWLFASFVSPSIAAAVGGLGGVLYCLIIA